jgi:hypothetical protein
LGLPINPHLIKCSGELDQLSSNIRIDRLGFDVGQIDKQRTLADLPLEVAKEWL